MYAKTIKFIGCQNFFGQNQRTTLQNKRESKTITHENLGWVVDLRVWGSIDKIRTQFSLALPSDENFLVT